LLLPLSCFSNSYTFGYTNNAASGGNTWGMTSPVLGVTVQEGLDISGVIYTYNPIKEVDDDFIVTVQNEKVGGGYIFQDTEDWSGKYPIRIRKVLQLPYVPIESFGQGSIATTGVGSIEDESVLYMYRFDACRNPQNDPSCPDYIPPLPPPPPKIYDVLDDDLVKEATKETDKSLLDDNEESDQKEKDTEEEDRLEEMLAVSENALALANGITQASLISAMNSVLNMDAYYLAQIPSKVYRETLVLKDQGISDNRKVLRSLSQDRLHNTMIEEQYK
jgi:hypothetical protein